VAVPAGGKRRRLQPGGLQLGSILNYGWQASEQASKPVKDGALTRRDPADELTRAYTREAATEAGVHRSSIVDPEPNWIATATRPKP
jgi:hypothetical protein